MTFLLRKIIISISFPVGRIGQKIGFGLAEMAYDDFYIGDGGGDQASRYNGMHHFLLEKMQNHWLSIMGSSYKSIKKYTRKG